MRKNSIVDEVPASDLSPFLIMFPTPRYLPHLDQGRCLTDFTMTMEGEEMHVMSKRDYQDCTYRPLQRKQPKKDKSRLTSSFKQEQKIDRVNSLLSHSSFQEGISPLTSVHEFVPHNGREHLAPITNTFTGELRLVQAGKPVRKREYLTDIQALGKRMTSGFRLTNLFMEGPPPSDLRRWRPALRAP
jgi:hypothetical protein